MDWKFTDIFRSNHGEGPALARVVEAREDALVMERWVGKGRPVRFELPPDYLDRRTCGWRRVERN